LGGGVSLGAGTLAYALFSPASVGCSTNWIVLTHSSVTARGCAAYSVIAHLGVGLIVLGAVLLLGSFALVVRTRRMAATAAPAAAVEASAPPAEAALATAESAPVPYGPSVADLPLFDAPVPAPAPEPAEPRAVDPAPVSETSAAQAHVPPESSSRPEPMIARSRPIAPGEGVYDDDLVLLDSAVRLPPGWYGNPNNPDRPVQWWDGTRLTDRPG
jgi:hypothetical protein